MGTLAGKDRFLREFPKASSPGICFDLERKNTFYTNSFFRLYRK